MKFKLEPLKAATVHLHDTLLCKVLKWLGYTLMTILFSAVTAIITVEWMVGCGETYIDAWGVRHQYECFILPLNKP